MPRTTRILAYVVALCALLGWWAAQTWGTASTPPSQDGKLRAPAHPGQHLTARSSLPKEAPVHAFPEEALAAPPLAFLPECRNQEPQSRFPGGVLQALRAKGLSPKAVAPREAFIVSWNRYVTSPGLLTQVGVKWDTRLPPSHLVRVLSTAVPGDPLRLDPRFGAVLGLRQQDALDRAQEIIEELRSQPGAQVGARTEILASAPFSGAEAPAATLAEFRDGEVVSYQDPWVQCRTQDAVFLCGCGASQNPGE